MILGADIFFDLIQYGKISGTQNQPSALNSKLGWLLSGKVSTACQSEKKVMSVIDCHALLDLQNQIAKFWEVESIPDASNLSEEDQKVEKFYLDHTRRNCDGRYVVSLPLKNDNALGDSKVQAKRRFISLEKRLQDNPELRDKYVKFMQDYEHLGHMQLVLNSELSEPSSKCFYLPHFEVVREQSETIYKVTDDLITGRNSKEDAKKLVCQVIELIKKGGFPIRKWASNESSVLEPLPPELRSSSGSLHIEEDHLMKILGIIWNFKEDHSEST
ncbi:DUF1758 domain-containing protein [Trichonephila clavipes]|nr:DUF1758 domain-containing protein [Trichonephila clavipes]